MVVDWLERNNFCLISDVFYRLHDGVDPFRVVHYNCGRVTKQIDDNIGYPRQLGDGASDGGGARCAGHASNGKADFVGPAGLCRSLLLRLTLSALLNMPRMFDGAEGSETGWNGR